MVTRYDIAITKRYKKMKGEMARRPKGDYFNFSKMK